MENAKQAAMINVNDAHEEVGKDKISRASLYNAIRRGEIPHVRLSRRILIPRLAFQDWLDHAWVGWRPATPNVVVAKRQRKKAKGPHGVESVQA